MIKIPYKPYEWAKAWHANKKRYSVLVLHRRAGKAQPLSSNVLTPSGFVKMGDISIGDMVMTPDGKKTKVLDIFPQGEQDVYEIKFANGATTRSTKEHLWQIEFGNRRRKGGVFDTAYIQKFLEQEKDKNYRSKSRPMTPLINKVAYGNDEGLIIDPYVLGLVIGDGGYSGNNSCRFSTLDDFFIQEINKFYNTKHIAGCDYRIYDIVKDLKTLGLYGVTSKDKKIPQNYINGSRQTRLELLRGLMDTDGYYAKGRSSAEFCSVSPELAEQVCFIARSLGKYATLSKPQKSGYRNKGQYIRCHDKYRVYIRIDEEPIFKLPRKQNQADEYRKRTPRAINKYVAITSIHQVGREDCQCILVEDEKHLYITDNFIVTHNTTATINELIRDSLLHENHLYAFISPTYKQAKRNVWDMIRFYCANIPGVQYNVSELTVVFPTGSKISLFGADNPDSLRGLTLHGVVFDEYSQQPSNIWSEIIAPTLATTKGYSIWIGTPKGRNAFYRIYEDSTRDEDWYSLLLPVSESHIIDEEELKQQRKNMTEDEYAQEWECSWEAAIQGAYYAKELSEARADGRVGKFPYDPTMQVYTWWDLGVSDATTILFMQTNGFQWRMIDCYSANDEGLEHYIKVVKDKPYVYAEHYAPHDIAVREFTSGLSRIETAEKLGISFEIAPKMSIDDGISSAKLRFRTLVIDEDKCRPFIDAIAQYRRDWNETMGDWKNKPLHDWTSHFADAFRIWAVTSITSSDPMAIRVSQNRQNKSNFK
jgi:hypothetical protein